MLLPSGGLQADSGGWTSSDSSCYLSYSAASSEKTAWTVHDLERKRRVPEGAKASLWGYMWIRRKVPWRSGSSTKMTVLCCSTSPAMEHDRGLFGMIFLRPLHNEMVAEKWGWMMQR